MFKKQLFPALLLLVSFTIVVYLGYFLDRTAFALLVSLWVMLFFITYYFVDKSNFSYTTLFYIGLFFRIVLLLAIPTLSQDFNRFIWDGRLLFQGINPYLSTPKLLMANAEVEMSESMKLFQAMGDLNASHYTNYPPVSQFGYWLAALIANKSILGSVVVLRLQLIAADIGIFYFGSKILKYLQLPVKNIFLYFLNPFVIVELTGNLHFEPVMVFFLVASLYFLLIEKWIWSAVLFGVSVNVKLLPLMFIPVFATYFYKQPLLQNSWRHSWAYFRHSKSKLLPFFVYFVIVLGVNVLLFLPFYNAQLLANYASSVGLWFKSFEFNASVYYIARWVGYQIVGWNTIATLGKVLPVFTVVSILALSLTTNHSKPLVLFKNLIFSASLYLLFTTTVHPWYLSIPLALSVFTTYKYVYVWSVTIILSYYAYSNPLFKENMLLIFLEYAIVMAVLIYELFFKKHFGHNSKFKLFAVQQ